MAANLLNALTHLSSVSDFSLPSLYRGSNRANNVGDALEFFVKDAFCGSLNVPDIPAKEKIYGKHLSYTGNTNNPPDFMVRAGDAVEVKKVERAHATLALNSSYPKNKLHADDPRITAACRAAEEWSEKDIIYAVGVLANGTLQSLWFVYGTCYAADKEVYEKTLDKVRSSLTASNAFDFGETTEIARINKVDPLGITYLRVRGMWGIESPISVFDYAGVTPRSPSIVAIMPVEKYNQFPAGDRENVEGLVADGAASVRDVEIKDPNNPANFIKAKVIEL